nr:hypothetical protein [Mycobacterium avium]
MSLQALMSFTGHVTPQMTIRYATPGSARSARGLRRSDGQDAPPVHPHPGRQTDPALTRSAVHSEIAETRVAHGYCARYEPRARALMPTSAKTWVTTTSPPPRIPRHAHRPTADVQAPEPTPSAAVDRRSRPPRPRRPRPYRPPSSA